MMPFPISDRSPVEHCGPLPGAADVVVIGGGIIGVMTAWHCAKRGLRTVLVEKGRVAGEQSSRNWGRIRQQNRDPAELPIMIESIALWRQLAAEVGEDLGLRQSGTMYLAEKAREVDAYEAWLPHAKEHGLDTRILSGAEVAQMLPDAARHWKGGMYTASDMRAEPWIAVPALARAAVRAGVTILENCAARTIDVAAGHVAGVVTEQGRIAASAVVVAGGSWSALLLRRHGISIPQLSVRATVVATAPMAPVFDSATSDTIAWRRRDDGGYTLAPDVYREFSIGPDAFRALPHYLRPLLGDPFGTVFRPAAPRGYPDAWTTPRRWLADGPSPFEAMRVLNPAPNARKVAQLARDFSAIFPGIGPTTIRTAWAGMIDTLPDDVPVVDTVAALPGLTVATGMCGHGFGIGPAFGQIAAALVTGNPPGHDITRFRIGRFSRGPRSETRHNR